MTIKKATSAKSSTATEKASVAKKTTLPKVEPTEKLTPLKEKLTKPQLLSHIAEKANLTKTQVATVLDALYDVIERPNKKPAVGEFVLPELRWSDLA